MQEILEPSLLEGNICDHPTQLGDRERDTWVWNWNDAAAHRVCPTPAVLGEPELQPITGLRLRKLVNKFNVRTGSGIDAIPHCAQLHVAAGVCGECMSAQQD